jgi:hypothetical protein
MRLNTYSISVLEIVDKMMKKQGSTREKQKNTSKLVLIVNGTPSRARTVDPLIKSQLLYQLS